MGATDSHVSIFIDFRRYKSGEMSDKEQNRFEKRLLEEPLLADAYEGYVAMIENNISPEIPLSALNIALQNRIQEDKSRIVPIWTYVAAASVILSVSWLVYTNKLQDENSNLETLTVTRPAPAIRELESAVPVSSLDSTIISKRIHVASRTGKVKSADLAVKEDTANRVASLEQEVTIPDENSNLRPDIAQTSSGFGTGATRSRPTHSFVSSPSVSTSKSTEIDSEIFKMVAHGRIVDADGMAVPGAYILRSPDTGVYTDHNGNFSLEVGLSDSLKITYIGYKSNWIKPDKADLGTIKLEVDQQALGEAVAIGYGATSSKQTQKRGKSAKAIPVGGWENYDAYLRQKSTDSRTGSVQVSFKVNRDGSLSDFSAKGARELRDSAINLIKIGPAWIPSAKTHSNSPEKVTVRVVFSN